VATRTFRLQVPISRSDVEELELNDIVYLCGRMFTLRDMAHERIGNHFREGNMHLVPFRLRDLVVFHGSPVVREKSEGGWEILSAGPTSSSRFSLSVKMLLEAMGPRVMVGKGTLTGEAIAAMRGYGAVYLQAVGGCAALYATKVKRVVANHWPEFGMVDSVWEFDIEDFGPLSVGIDCRGNSSYRGLRETTLKKNLLRVYEELGIDPESDFAWWPLAAAGSKEAFKRATSSKA
jgi:fumarate hydratase subunit beta